MAESTLSMEDAEQIRKDLEALNLMLFRGQISPAEYNLKSRELMLIIERNSLIFGTTSSFSEISCSHTIKIKKPL
jgi:hypothetical protein